MKYFSALIFVCLISTPAFAKSSKDCGSKKTWISCAEIDSAKREGFCSKSNKLSEKSIKNRCVRSGKVAKKTYKSKKKLAKKKVSPKKKRSTKSQIKSTPKSTEISSENEV